jgi:hypothetical protein
MLANSDVPMQKLPKASAKSVKPAFRCCAASVQCTFTAEHWASKALLSMLASIVKDDCLPPSWDAV